MKRILLSIVIIFAFAPVRAEVFSKAELCIKEFSAARYAAPKPAALKAANIKLFETDFSSLADKQYPKIFEDVVKTLEKHHPKSAVFFNNMQTSAYPALVGNVQIMFLEKDTANALAPKLKMPAIKGEDGFSGVVRKDGKFAAIVIIIPQNMRGYKEKDEALLWASTVNIIFHEIYGHIYDALKNKGVVPGYIEKELTAHSAAVKLMEEFLHTVDRQSVSSQKLAALNKVLQLEKINLKHFQDKKSSPFR